MKKIMFLCTANSCRSQMTEGLARELGKDVIEPYGAGLIPSCVHPRAIEVMKEMASFDKFAQFIENRDYDVIIFDTARQAIH